MANAERNLAPSILLAVSAQTERNEAWVMKCSSLSALPNSPFEQGGGAKGIRTPDLLIANETLYQLSYSPFMRS